MYSKQVKVSQASEEETDRHEVSDVLSCLPLPKTQMQGLMELAAALYWEQDEDFRFTVSLSPANLADDFNRQALIGKQRWDDGAIPIGEDSWECHKNDLRARRPFKDLLYSKPAADGTRRYITTSGSPFTDQNGRFCGYMGIARDITPEYRSQHLLKLEHAISSTLAHAADIRSAFQSSTRAICKAEDFEIGEYWSLDPELQVMRYYEGWSIADRTVKNFTLGALNYTFERGTGLVGWVWRHESPLWVADLSDDPRIKHKAAFRKLGWKSALLFPVTVDGEVIGILNFLTRRNTTTPDDGLLQVIRGFGAQIGQFYQRSRAQELLRDSEERLQSTLQLAGVGIAHIGTDGQFIFANPRLCEILGYSEQELLERTVKDISHPHDRDVTAEILPKLRAGEMDSFKVEKRYLSRDGTTIWAALTITVKHDTSGRFLHDVCIIEDISSRKHAEVVLRESEERFRALASLSSDWYWETDLEFRFTRLEGRHVEIGKDVDANIVLGKARWEIGLEIEADDGWSGHRALLESHRPFRNVIVYRIEPNESASYFSISGEPLFDGDRFAGYRGVGRDVTARKQAESHIQHMATHDKLTDLPNRFMFSQLLGHTIESARRYDHRFAVLFIDLDRFKIINDTLGHEAGDHLLQEMSTRFSDCLRTSDVVARLGGDEFVVLVQEIKNSGEAASVAQKMLSAANKPLYVAGHECQVTASIGIALYPRDANDEQSLMKNADIAMYLAKGGGKNNFHFYSSETRMQPDETMSLETGLRRALEQDEFSLHYQPRCDLETGVVTGVEALLRWQSSTLGPVSPSRFVPVAEESGLVIPIGQWVLNKACEQSVAWRQAGLPRLHMSVNISPLQFKDEALLDHIEQALADSGLPAQALELEITEGMVMHDTERTRQLLNAIRSMGASLAIDDFGTGHSSLAQLKRFPIDTLKVDRSFVRDLPEDSEDRAITEAIISMGKSLNLRIVAEGVETEAQENFLREQGCNEMQGYLFCKPLPADEFAAFLEAYLEG